MDEQPIQTTETAKKISASSLLVPVAIVIAGGLIASSLYMGRNIAPVAVVANNQGQQNAPAQPAGSLEKMNPIGADDHVRGNPDAPVKIVEYTDPECPFCKRFHETMKQVMGEYGKDGKVAWVYRNFPLDQLHPKARKEAVAVECAGAIGGKEMFWKYADRLYEITPSNNRLDPAELPNIAKYVGLDVSTFNTCLTSGKFDAHVEADIQNAVATGGNGTPWSVVIGVDGKKYPLSGAQPYEAVKRLIEVALKSPSPSP